MVRLIWMVGFLLFFPSIAQSEDIDINKIIQTVQNLTEAINHIEVDAHNGTEIAREYLSFFKEQWPSLKEQVKDLTSTGTKIGADIKLSLFALAGSILGSTLIFSITKIVYYNCKRNRHHYSTL